MSLSNTSTDTFIILECFSCSQMSLLRILWWSESSASALWDLLKNTRGHQAKRNSSSWWKHSALCWNWWRSVSASLSRQLRLSLCPGTLYTISPICWNWTIPTFKTSSIYKLTSSKTDVLRTFRYYLNKCLWLPTFTGQKCNLKLNLFHLFATKNITIINCGL